MKKAVYSFALVLPLGYSQRMGKSYPGTPAKELTKAFGAEFGWVSFKVDHLADGVFRIKIKMTDIPKAQGGLMNLTEIITGMTGDVLRLSYGQVVTIEGPHQGSLMIRISS